MLYKKNILEILYSVTLFIIIIFFLLFKNSAYEHWSHILDHDITKNFVFDEKFFWRLKSRKLVMTVYLTMVVNFWQNNRKKWQLYLSLIKVPAPPPGTFKKKSIRCVILVILFKNRPFLKIFNFLTVKLIFGQKLNS